MYDRQNDSNALYYKSATPQFYRNYSTSTSLNTNNQDNIRELQEKLMKNNYMNDYHSRQLMSYINQKNYIDSQSNSHSRLKSRHARNYEEDQLLQERIQLSYTPSPSKNYMITKENNALVEGNNQRKNYILPPKSNPYMSSQMNTFANSHVYKTEHYFLNVCIYLFNTFYILIIESSK